LHTNANFQKIYKKIIFSFDIFKKKILIVGKNAELRTLRREFRQNWYLGLRYSNKFFESIFIISNDLDISEVNALTSKYHHTNEVYLMAVTPSLNISNADILEYSNIKANFIRIDNKLLNKSNIFIKNIFDIFVSLIILPFFLILHFILFILINFDSRGGVFFTQERLAKTKGVFKIYKYRTMYANSDGILKRYLDKNPEELKYYEKYHKYKNNPRITKIGRFLRTSSLDEVPQFINILKGDMSLIGPRPYLKNEEKKLGKDKDFILKVKPGITGLWQVSGRSKLSFKRRNVLEVYYIKNWSLWADIIILFKSVKVVFGKFGAS